MVRIAARGEPQRMKILYIANEFLDVQVASRALRGLSPDVTILWGYSADRAAFWIRENPDLAALIVEIQIDSQGCVFLNRARSLGLQAPIVVVLPEGAAPPHESLEAGADDFVAKNQSFSRELPIVVTRAIERAQTVSGARWDLFSEVRVAGATASAGTAEPSLGSLDGPSTHGLERSWAVEQSAALERREDLEELIHRERAARTELEQALTHSAAALQDAERREAELTSTLADVIERQAAIKAQFEREVENRRNVEELLAQSELARDDAETRHEAAMTTAAALFAERLAQLDADVAEAVTARTTLLQETQGLEAALKGAEQILASHAAEAERLTRREAELTAMLADAIASRNVLGARLADIDTASKDAEEYAARDRLTAAEKATEREADLDERIRQERVTRTLVEQKLAQVEAAWRAAEEQHASAITLAAATFAERQAQFESQLSQSTAARDDLARQLSDVEAALERSRRLEVEHRDERKDLERSRLAAEAEARQLAERHAEVERNLEDARREFQRTLDAFSNEYADAQATLVASLSERDARLEEQARHAASAQASELGRSQLQDGLRTSLAAREHEIEEIQKTLKATALELVSARARCESMQTHVPKLQQQLDESRLEARRQFHRAPVALGRCTRDGALTRFNRAFADLVGYRNPNELRGADFGSTLFESPDDLSWLIERCVSTHARESIETAWKKKHGERLVVRLSALESAPDLIEIAAEDITDLRVLQDRLGQAHRMEAVGRLASEISIACGNLLRDIRQDAQQMLTMVGDNTALRQRGETLLENVTRAAGFLQKLAMYRDEQANALDKVDLDKVLRDPKPVLKHVAGALRTVDDQVQARTPDTRSRLGRAAARWFGR